MKTALYVLAASALGLACGTTTPPSQLVDARVAYQRASTSEGAALATTDLYDAKTALNEAEHSFKEDGDDPKTKSLAYVAHRRAISAQAKANTAKALQDKRTAEAQFQQFQQQNALALRDQLDSTKSALTQAQRDAEAARRARSEAEDKTRDLLNQINGLKAQPTDRGLVVTLSGSVLFATNKADLLPAAKTRLGEVANALKQDQRSMIVVGHTDATGGDDLNQRLSENRAKSVRTYLVSQGVPENRIRSEGMGKSQPVADNASPEGRANNRRVEIILENNGQQQQGAQSGMSGNAGGGR